MKRNILLTLAAAAFLLAVTSANAATKPRLPTPVCKITGAKYYPATGRLIGQGRCTYKLRLANGKQRTVTPSGTKWTYGNLSIFDQTGAACGVAKLTGVGNSALVQPAGTYKATATYRLWLPKNRYHTAAKAVTKTVAVVLGGSSAACGTPSVVAPEGPNSPTGSGNGGNAQSGFIVGWAGAVTVTSSKVQTPALDASGNGQCRWVPDGGAYQKYGYTFYTGALRCTNGVYAFVFIHLDVTRPDGTTCQVDVSGVADFPLKAGWGGSFSGRVAVSSADNSNVPQLPIPLQQGTAGGPPLC